MSTVNPKKIKLLKLYEILRQHTDQDCPLSTNQLCAILKSEGITCDRRTLAKDIDILNANGFEVLRRRTRYAMLFYTVDRRFDLAEVKILIDAIQVASFITPQKAKELTDKVASLAGSHRAAVLKGNLVTFNTRKHTNESIYYTVDALENALQQRCKSSFRYFDLNERGERVFRKDGERYLVNPIGLVYHEDNYYLVTYHEIHEATVNYRVDRMADIQLEDAPVAEQAITLSSELGTYTERIFKMFNGPQATVELQFDRKLIDAVYDKFGEGIKIITGERGFCKATVEVLISPVFFAWCFQFGKSMKILSPESIVLEMKDHAKKVMGLYRGIK